MYVAAKIKLHGRYKKCVSCAKLCIAVTILLVNMRPAKFISVSVHSLFLNPYHFFAAME